MFKNEKEAIVKILTYYNNRDMVDIMGVFSQQICEREFDMDQNFPTYRDIYKGELISEF